MLILNLMHSFFKDLVYSYVNVKWIKDQEDQGEIPWEDPDLVSM